MMIPIRILFGLLLPTLLLPDPVRGQAIPAPGVPSIRIGGFADVTLESRQGESAPDFRIGQFVVHTGADIGADLSFFSELSLNSLPTWETRAERLHLAWNPGDHLTLKVGRLHVPITWWNSNFHHGTWLQATAQRPRMLDFDGNLIPNHVRGISAEGSIPGGQAAGLRYHASLAGGGDNHTGHAGHTPMGSSVTLGWSARPQRLPRLEIGSVVMLQKADASSAQGHGTGMDGMDGMDGILAMDQDLLGLHLAWTGEHPELLGEVVFSRHRVVEAGAMHHEGHAVADLEPVGSGTGPIGAMDHSSTGASPLHRHWVGYAQVGWRIRGFGERLKPYVRTERIRLDASDPSLRGRSDEDLWTVGVRFDPVTSLAIKMEGLRRSVPGIRGQWEFRAQVSTAW